MESPWNVAAGEGRVRFAGALPRRAAPRRAAEKRPIHGTNAMEALASTLPYWNEREERLLVTSMFPHGRTAVNRLTG
jgi:hypothetical protein